MGLYQRDGNWFIDYRVGGRRKRKKIGPNKALAENVLRKIKVEIAENKYLDVKKEQKIRFEDFAEEYLNCHSKINNRAWRHAELPNINRLKLLLGGKYLYEISSQTVEQIKAQILQEVSPATTNRVLTLLKSIFNKATLWGKFDGKNPVKGTKFFKEQPRLRFLEKEEIMKLLSNCNEHLKPFVIIALNTGMRKGEISNLKWHDVDFKINIIYLYQTKNGERREIPMNKQVRNALISVQKSPVTPYIFHRREYKPYYNLRKSFFTACKNSGIINFRFHDLRHTFASQLVMSGVDLNTVRELLGHKSLEMTLRYSHLSQDHKKRAVDILGSHLDAFRTLDTKVGISVETDSSLTTTEIKN